MLFDLSYYDIAILGFCALGLGYIRWMNNHYFKEEYARRESDFDDHVNVAELADASYNSSYSSVDIFRLKRAVMKVLSASTDTTGEITVVLEGGYEPDIILSARSIAGKGLVLLSLHFTDQTGFLGVNKQKLLNAVVNSEMNNALKREVYESVKRQDLSTIHLRHAGHIVVELEKIDVFVQKYTLSSFLSSPGLKSYSLTLTLSQDKCETVYTIPKE